MKSIFQSGSLAALVAGSSLALLGGVAHGATVTGSLWAVSNAIAEDAVPANIPAAPPLVTFTAPTPLNFCSQETAAGCNNNSPSYTIGGFLQSGGATATSGTSHLTDSLNDHLFNITGLVTVTTGQTFTVGHDDGLTLIIDGMTVISAPGPTSFEITNATYTGPDGTFPFQLVYGEADGAPAALEIGLPLSAVPLPAALPLFLSGLGGLGLLGWRTKRKATAAS